MPQRVLSEPEFNAIRDRLLSEAPAGMDEASFHRWIGPRMAAAIGEAENTPAAPEGSALARFASNAGEMLNPVAAVKGIAQAVAHPIDTAKAVYGASADQASKAATAAREGRYFEALGHAGATIPVVGPAAAEAGEQIARGDIAGGLGKAAGLLIPAAAPAVARGAARVATTVAPEGLRATVAEALTSKAARSVADVMTPKVGANKTRFAGMAERVAPEVAADNDLTAWSREGLHSKVAERLDAATSALDAAADARLSARTFNTKPLIEALKEKRRALTAETVDASKPAQSTSTRASAILDAQGKPIEVTAKRAESMGNDVVPAPNAARVAEIDRAIDELQQLGPAARYESIRRIRQAYDGPAKAVYNPSLTQDFMKAQGGKLGAADVTGVLREALAKWDPETAKANAQYSLYKSANDTLNAVAEVEKTRPKVGRRIAARVLTTILGEHAAGVPGAVGGYLLSPAVDAATGAGFTTRLQTANLMTRLATAIRAGDEARVVSLTYDLRRLSAQAATITGRLTSPSGSQTAPAGAR
jgi:hypothetical protein